MNTRTTILIQLGLLVFCAPAWGDGDPVSGERKAALCMQCHGPKGYSITPMVPNLAGQLPRYIIHAIVEFKTDIRTNNLMSKIAETIVMEDMEDIAAYFSSQPRKQGKPTGTALSKQGEKLFLREKCSYCHNDDGRRFVPFVPTVPFIGGQRQDYLVKAIKDIRDAYRPADDFGLMRGKISPMSDQQIEALAEYISGL